MEEKDLIEKVRNKDSDACALLLERYNKMIYSIIHSYELNCGDYQVAMDDLYQEACIGLYEACVVYRDDRGAQFSTFVYLVMRRRVNHFYKSMRNAYLKENHSIDTLEGSDHYEITKEKAVGSDPLVYHHDQIRNEEVRKLIRTLSAEDRQILYLRLEDRSYAEIAKILKIKRKRVDNRLAKMRRLYNEKTRYQ